MNWMAMLAVFVAWLIAALAVVAVRGKQLSRQFCLWVFLCSSLGAGTVQYFVSAGLLRIERLSAAHLAGVSCLQLKDDVAFVRQRLCAPLGQENNDQVNAAQIDWAGTFRMKAEDISATLAAVERNAFIRDYYSVWAGDIEFRRNQLDRAAQRVVATDDGGPRQANVDSYLDCLDLAIDQLDRLAHEMRSRTPEDYF